MNNAKLRYEGYKKLSEIIDSKPKLQRMRGLNNFQRADRLINQN